MISSLCSQIFLITILLEDTYRSDAFLEMNFRWDPSVSCSSLNLHFLQIIFLVQARSQCGLPGLSGRHHLR